MFPKEFYKKKVVFQNSPKVTIHLGNFCYKKFYPELKNCRIWSHCNASNFCCVSFFVFRAKKYERGTHNVFLLRGPPVRERAGGKESARPNFFFLARPIKSSLRLTFIPITMDRILSLSLSLSFFLSPSLFRSISFSRCEKFHFEKSEFFSLQNFLMSKLWQSAAEETDAADDSKRKKIDFSPKLKKYSFCVETFLILLTIVNFF